MRRIEILPSALAEVSAARDWYEAQREGLGSEFEAALDAALAGILRVPELYPKVVGNVRRCLLGRFPYGVFYEMFPGELIVVAAVIHGSRDPKNWPGCGT